MSGVSMVSYSMAPAIGDSSKPSKKRKKRSSSSSSSAYVSSSMADAGWTKVNIEDMQLDGFQDGCAFELEELTTYRVETTADGGKILARDSKSEQEQSDEKKKTKKRRRKLKITKQQSEIKIEGNCEEKEAMKQEQDSDIGQDQSDEKKKKRRRVKVTKQQSESSEKIKDNSEEKVAIKQEQVPTQRKKHGDAEKDAKSNKKKKNRAGKAKKKDEQLETVALKDIKLPKWTKYKLHPLLMQSLQTCGFSAPTRIQERTLLPALVDNRDVVGAAPTGSGKTLAFGLPILSQLLYEREQPGYKKDCKALILTPTRELAIQIQQHLEKMVRHREIGVVTLVGGMAVQKQKRILSYRPEIVIGTPGRLWDIMQTNHEHMKDIASTLRFLVVDEADRMLQPGSYAELEKIFNVLHGKSKDAATELLNLSDDEEEDDEASDDENAKKEHDEEGDDEDIEIDKFTSGAKVMMLDDVLKMQQRQRDKEKEGVVVEDSSESNKAKARMESACPPRHVRQTFLFSATLTIPEGGRFQKSKARKHRNALSVLERVMKRVGLRGKPAVVDLGIAEPEIGFPGAKSIVSEESRLKLKKQQENVALSLPAGLELCQHEVTESTRDSFLYYFLTQYPGRTIIFLNAIHQVRKLASLLSLLNLPVFALHAEMQQRQRLKKLDGFRAHSKGILVATDVAARGLDIPSVDYVVHYHIARSTEVFVHRSGRTARANKEGLSIALVSPTDAKNHAQICKMLQRPTGLSNFPFDHRYLEAIDERMRLAKSINEQENAAGKLKSEATWFEQMAAAADLDLDDDLLFELGAKQRNQDGKKKTTQNQSVKSLRAQLERLLAGPLRPVGSARKFRQLHKELGSQLSGDGEYRTRNANEDLIMKGKKAYKRFRRRG